MATPLAERRSQAGKKLREPLRTGSCSPHLWHFLPLRTPNPPRHPATKDHQLETEESEQGGGRDCAEFGDQDIGRKRVEAKADDCNRHEPTAKDVEAVLRQLFAVIGSPAAKNPEFIQKEMTRHPGQVRNADRHQRLQEKVQHPNERKVNGCNRASHREEPDYP
jgi:hypothetical protein